MSLVRVADAQVKCQCGEVLYFLTDTELGEGFYRVQHGERPEAVSPLINGVAGERSMAWREEVHAHLGAACSADIPGPIEAHLPHCSVRQWHEAMDDLEYTDDD